MRVKRNLNSKISERNKRVKGLLNFLRVRSPKSYQQLLTKFPSRRSLGAEHEETTAPAEETSWWSNFAKDLLETAAAVKTSQTLDKSEQRALELEIQKINASSASIEKQISLQRAKNAATVTGGAKYIFSDLMSNPMTLAAVGLLGILGFSIYRRKSKKR